jgi:hypothetical protein
MAGHGTDVRPIGRIFARSEASFIEAYEIFMPDISSSLKLMRINAGYIIVIEVDFFSINAYEIFMPDT